VPARILIIEDNDANLELMSYLLGAFGHAIVAARDGHEGLETAMRNEADLILCDIQLPKIGGMEIASRLRSDPEFARIPMVAVTALAMVGDRETIMAAGFDGYITKPIEPTHFVQQIDGFLPAHKRAAIAQRAAATGDARPSTRPPGRRVLVVDDQQVNLQLASSILGGSGYEVITASSMAEGMRMVRDAAPHLILSDVCMAENASGYDFIAALKADPALRSIPFVFVTSTMNTEQERQKGLALGAERYLFRPIEPQDLLREVAACFGDAKGT
jgi:two-component system cell cycle response regulator